MPLLTGRRLPAASAAAVAVLTLTLTACGGGGDQPEVATAATGDAGAATPTPTVGVVEQYVRAKRAYVACMRDNGIDLPDPDPKGNIVDEGRRINKTDPKFLAAGKKCGPLLPPVPKELQPTLPPKSPKQIADARRYAACMRDNGVPSFPDPGPGGWFDGEGASSETEQESAALFRAGQICEPLLAGRPSSTPGPVPPGQG